MNAKPYVIARRDSNSTRLEYFRGKKSPFRGEWTCLASEALSGDKDFVYKIWRKIDPNGPFETAGFNPNYPTCVFMMERDVAKPDFVALPEPKKKIAAQPLLSQAAAVFEKYSSMFDELKITCATTAQVLDHFIHIANESKAVKLLQSTGTRNWLTILYIDSSIIGYEDDAFCFYDNSTWSLITNNRKNNGQKIEEIKF